MDMDDIIDLDVLRPKQRVIKIGGKTIDVSYVPCAITFEVDIAVGKISAYDVEKLKENGEETKNAFKDILQLCVLYCKHKYPEMNEQWFLDNTTASQVEIFAHEIQEALKVSYNGIGTYGKN